MKAIFVLKGRWRTS
ncbi:TPA: trp operon leader peptide [Escherichia coli]|nr:trp operon leader peptide [Escherichia albertii]